MLVSLVIMIIYTSYPRHYPAVYYIRERFGGLLVLGVANINEGSIHQLNYDATIRRKKDIISSIYWHLLTPRGCTRLWTIVYVGRTVLRVYYLICVPFIIVICNKKYYQ